MDAAYDVFLNKKEWRSPDAARREMFAIPGASISRTGGEFRSYVATELKMEVHIFDSFGVYLRDLGGNLNGLHKDLWYKTAPIREEGHTMSVQMVERSST